MFETKTKLPPWLVEDAIHIRETNFRMLQGLCNDCNPSHSLRQCALLLLRSAPLRIPPLSGGWIKDTRVQPIISNDPTKHWPSQTMHPDFFLLVWTVHLLITSHRKARLVFSLCFGSVSRKMDQGAFKYISWKPRSVPFGTFQHFFFSLTHEVKLLRYISETGRFSLSPKTFNLVGKYFSVFAQKEVCNGEHETRCQRAKKPIKLTIKFSGNGYRK